MMNPNKLQLNYVFLKITSEVSRKRQTDVTFDVFRNFNRKTEENLTMLYMKSDLIMVFDFLEKNVKTAVKQFDTNAF